MNNTEKNGKLLITESALFPGEPFAALIDGKRLRQIQFFSETEERTLNQIHIARVDKVVNNLSAAFVEIEKGKMCYLPLEHIDKAIFTKKISKKPIAQDEELLVQVTKEAVKSKVPVATTDLTLNGQYAVLLPRSSELRFSKKLSVSQRSRLTDWFVEFAPKIGNYGLLMRTESQFAEIAQIEEEVFSLIEKWENIIKYSSMRTRYSCLYKPNNGVLPILQYFYSHEYCEMITDIPDIYEKLKDCCEQDVRFYEDKLLSLSKLYNVDKQLSDAQNRQLWLKSGASLYIEQTEALVSIDINSGKNIIGKSKEETILKINLEAAEEIAAQVRLRRLSGILIIDFINMKSEAYQKQVLNALREAFQGDPMSPVVVGMTKLGLVEATRSKKERPLWEQLRKFKQNL